MNEGIPRYQCPACADLGPHECELSPDAVRNQRGTFTHIFTVDITLRLFFTILGTRRRITGTPRTPRSALPSTPRRTPRHGEQARRGEVPLAGPWFSELLPQRVKSNFDVI